MIPISRLDYLKDEINLNPFEIYFLITPGSPQELKIKELIDRIWKKHPLIGQIFRVKLIDKGLFTDGEFHFYYRKVLEDVNIMARVIRPASDRIRIELGYIWCDGAEEDFTEDFLAFLYQLCKTDIEELSQTIIDTQFSIDERNAANCLFFLEEIENGFRSLATYLRNKMRESSLYRVRQNMHKSSSNNLLCNIANLHALPSILHKITGEMTPIEAKAATLNLGVVSTDQALDADLTITLLSPSLETKLPRLSFSLFGQAATTNRGFKEGIYLYVCALVEYVNGKTFYKSKFTDFLKKLKFHLNDAPERFASINRNEMDPDLYNTFDYFKSIYDALFSTRIDKFHAPTFVDSQSFEEWCIRLVYNQRDSFNQGLSNLRRNIMEAMASVGMGYLVGKVNMKSISKELKPCVVPGNIYFPATPSWKNLVPHNNLLRSDSSDILFE